MIAIENVRLFNETKEALERQTATAEILSVDQRFADGRAAGVRRDRAEPASACCGTRFAVLQLLHGDDGLHLAPSTASRASKRCANAIRARSTTPRHRRARDASRGRRCTYAPVIGRSGGAAGDRASSRGDFGFNSVIFAPMIHEGKVHRRDRRRAVASPGPFDEQADRAAEDLRRPGGDRDRERAPVQRDQGGARAADGDGGDPAGHRELAVRRAAGVRRDRRRARTRFARRLYANVVPRTTARCCIAWRREQSRAATAWTLMRASYPMRPDASQVVRPRDVVRRRVVRHRGRVSAIPDYDPRAGRDRRLARACSACRCCARATRSASIVVARGRARAVHRAPDRAAPDLRRPGGDRDRERAPVQRDQGGARAADGDGGDPQGHRSSPSDVQPVFDAIVAQRARSCSAASRASVTRMTGTTVHLAARTATGRSSIEWHSKRFYRPTGSRSSAWSLPAAIRVREVCDFEAMSTTRSGRVAGVRASWSTCAGYRGDLAVPDAARRRGDRHDQRLPRGKSGPFTRQGRSRCSRPSPTRR